MASDTITPEKPKRESKPLTKLQFGQLVAEQKAMCGCLCGKPLVFEPHQIRDEHLVQLSMGGSDEVSNRSLYRLQCAKLKAVMDAGRRAKVRSLTKATKKSQKPKAKIAAHVNGLQSGRKLQSKNSPVYSNTRIDD